MLKPSVEVHNIEGFLVAEFWDCLRLDPGAVQSLRNKYEEHLRTGGRPQLVIDLLGVAFAGSASLGHFVALQRIAGPKNGRLIFCNVDPTVLEVFRATKLVPLFSFVSDRDAGLAEATSLSQGGVPTPGPSEPAAPSGPSDDGSPSKSGGGGLLRSSRRRKLS